MKGNLKDYFAKIGRRGGKAKSPAKVEAGRRNMEKARQAKALKAASLNPA